MRHQKWVMISGAFLCLISLSAYPFYKFLIKDYHQSIAYQNPVTVIIKPGQSARQIGKQLEDAHVIGSEFTFYINAVLRRRASQLKAGEYEFPTSRSIENVTDKLVHGKVVQHKITIPEGLTTQEVRALILKEDKLTGPLADHLSEGMFLPETYYFTRGEQRGVLLRRMQKALEDTLRFFWQKHERETILNSPQEALILASIVEKETPKAIERPHISGVFINRLKQRMPLQADPTVIYGITQLTGQKLERALTTEDLTLDTPYNTYVKIGLPPQPICNPSRASIEATLNPTITKDLYFVADGTGGHVFAESLKDHQENHAKWRKIRQDRKQSE